MIAGVLGVLALVGYLVLAGTGRRPWPAGRSLCWAGGCLAAVAGVLVSGSGGFAAHMVGHLLVGMLAPLLLVLAAPVTLLLRRLPTSAGRRLVAVLRSPVARLLTEPAVAAVLAVGGLWLIYTTPIFGALHERAWLHALVHGHLLAAGYLFTAVLVGPDPQPHRRGVVHRSVVLVAALAAHDVLAKRLYAAPPAGVARADGELGALIMYYGGDAVDVVIMVLLCAGWYRAAGRRRRPVPAAASAIGHPPQARA